MNYLKEILTSKKSEIKSIESSVDYEIKSSGAQNAAEKVLKNQFDLKIFSKKRKNKSLIKNIKDGRVNIIAEIKKASPSRGLINPDLNISSTALLYDRYSSFICGISVITEPVYFKGSSDYLIEVKKVSELPVLRKDFIFHRYQIYESAAKRADCILLICSILGYKKLKDLYDFASEIGLEVLVEVHNENEFDKALKTGANFVGINNRDLRTMKVNIDNTRQILKYSKNRKVSELILVCESGIEDINYIEELYSMGINTFLMGSYFMKSRNLDDDLSRMEMQLAEKGMI
ncbi:MAG: indole-3-glycerol-phosphate synthase [Actinobacteria bacterium]|nr:indole-3-glycerol-phosphate synthase [Actinomycetota bacterium]